MIRGEPLYELQDLDLELEQGRRRISEIQQSLGETETVLQAREALAQAQEQHSEWLRRMRNLELEIGGLTTRITSSEKRLYGGRVTNPKELSDIQNEIAYLKRRRAELEDELLEAMLQAEAAEERVETRSEALVRIEADWQDQQKQLREELNQLETRLAQAEEERKQLRQSIHPEDVALYDKIRSRHGPIAVAVLQDGVCGFCAVAPSSTKLARIRSGRELLQCSNCSRILLDL
jgi:predicted  nucleic acid-binding Zn-ribbon protein